MIPYNDRLHIERALNDSEEAAKQGNILRSQQLLLDAALKITHFVTQLPSESLLVVKSSFGPETRPSEFYRPPIELSCENCCTTAPLNILFIWKDTGDGALLAFEVGNEQTGWTFGDVKMGLSLCGACRASGTIDLGRGVDVGDVTTITTWQKCEQCDRHLPRGLQMIWRPNGDDAIVAYEVDDEREGWMFDGRFAHCREHRLPCDPDAKNADRAGYAETALAAYRAETNSDAENALGDLLTDLMHWADRNGDDSFASEITRAQARYFSETAPDGGI